MQIKEQPIFWFFIERHALNTTVLGLSNQGALLKGLPDGIFFEVGEVML